VNWSTRFRYRKDRRQQRCIGVCRYRIKGIFEIKRVRHRAIRERRHRQSDTIRKSEDARLRQTSVSTGKFDKRLDVIAAAACREHHPQAIEDRALGRGDRRTRDLFEVGAREMSGNECTQLDRILARDHSTFHFSSGS
jgi:hypothetical protein